MTDDAPRHGTHAGYYCIPCRDPERCPAELDCTAAAARYERHRVYAREKGVMRRLDACGTRRRIYALRAIGWTDALIADAAGLPSPFAVSQACTRRFVSRATATGIAAAYSALSDRRGRSVRNVKRAERLGWPPPIAWDYEPLDDPTAPPYSDTAPDPA